MSEITKFLNESLNENIEIEALKEKYKEELKGIEDAFLKYFPNGAISVGIRKSIGEPTLSIMFTLIGKQEDYPNGILRNDPLYHTFIGHYRSGSDKFDIENLQGGLSVKPSEGSYMAMETIKTGFRKKSATLDTKLVKFFDGWFKKVAKIVSDNKDNIYGVEDLDPKYLEVKA